MKDFIVSIPYESGNYKLTDDNIISLAEELVVSIPYESGNYKLLILTISI